MIPLGFNFEPLRTEQDKLILNKTLLLRLLEGTKIDEPHNVNAIRTICW